MAVIPTVRASVAIRDESAAPGADHTGTIPAEAVAGDIALLFTVQNTGANTAAPPTGWTQLAGPHRVNSNLSCYLFGRELTAADAGASVTVTWSGAVRGCAVLVVVQGADNLPELVVAATPNAAGGDTFPLAAVTTPEDECAVVGFVAGRAASTTPLDVTFPAGWTEAIRSNTAHLDTPNLTAEAASLDGGAATAGPYGGQTATAAPTLSAVISYAVALTAVNQDPGLWHYAVLGDASLALLTHYVVMADGELRQVSGPPASQDWFDADPWVDADPWGPHS